MSEIELRTECVNCDGKGGFYHQCSNRIVECYKCKGTGLGHWSEIIPLELEDKENDQAIISQNHL